MTDTVNGIKVRCFRRGTSIGPYRLFYVAVFPDFPTRDPDVLMALEIDESGRCIDCDAMLGPQLGGERRFMELPEIVQQQVAAFCNHLRPTIDAVDAHYRMLRGGAVRRIA